MDETAGERDGVAPLPVHGGSGTLPGVDLEDHRGLADLMDGDVPLVALR